MESAQPSQPSQPSQSPQSPQPPEPPEPPEPSQQLLQPVPVYQPLVFHPLQAFQLSPQFRFPPDERYPDVITPTHMTIVKYKTKQDRIQDLIKHVNNSLLYSVKTDGQVTVELGCWFKLRYRLDQEMIAAVKDKFSSVYTFTESWWMFGFLPIYRLTLHWTVV